MADEGFIFDEASLFKDIQLQAQEAEKRQAAFEKARVSSTAAVQDANTDFMTQLNALSAESDSVTNEALAVLEKMETAQANPFRELIGLFDADYNMDVLQSRLTQTQLKAGQTSSRLRSAQLLRDSRVATAQADVKNKAQLEISSRQALETSVSMLGLGMRIEDDAREEDIQALEDMSVEEIGAIRQSIEAGDEKSVPARFRNKPGLVEAAFQKKRLEGLGLTQAGIAAERQKLALQQEKQADSLSKYDDNALRVMMQQETFPEGLNKNVVNAELQRRTSIAQSLARNAQIMELGQMQIEEAERAGKSAVIAETLRDTSDEALRQMLESGQMPEGLNRNIIQKELAAREGESLSQRAARTQLSIAEASAAKTRQQAMLDNKTVSDLRNMLLTDTIPTGLSRQAIENELRIREVETLGLEREQIATQAGRLQLQGAIKGQVLSSSTLGELREAYENAAATGTAEISSGGNSMEFTKEELNTAILAKEKALEETLKGIAEKATMTAGARSKIVTNNIAISNINKQLDPGAVADPENPLANARPEVLQLLSESTERLKELESIKQSLPTESAIVDPMIAQEVIAIEEKVNTLIADIVKRVPKKQKNGTEEYLRNSRITNTRNAADLLSSEAVNSEALNHNPVIGGMWRGVSNEFVSMASETGGNSVKTDPKTGELTIAKLTSQDEASILQQAMKKLKFRDNASVAYLQKTFSEAILSIQAETKNKNTGQSPVDGLVDPRTGLLSSAFYVITESGQRIFDPAAVNVALSQRSVALRDQGILSQDERLQDIVYPRVEQLTRELNFTDRNLGSGAAEAAVASFAFNNDLGQFVRKKLVGLQMNVDAAEQYTTDTNRALKEENVMKSDIVQMYKKRLNRLADVEENDERMRALQGGTPLEQAITGITQTPEEVGGP